MKILVTNATPLQQDSPLLVLLTWETQALPSTIAGLIEAEDWTGKAQQQQLVYPNGVLQARRLLLLGLGKADAATPETFREAGALAAKQARALKLSSVTIALPTPSGIAVATATQALVEGVQLGSYHFLQFKSNPDQSTPELSEVTILSDAEDIAQAGAVIGSSVARGAAVARDLANRPSNDLTPAALAEAARAIGEQFHFKTTILDRNGLQEQGFGGILAVGQGSANEPRFIVLEHGEKRDGKPTIALVGKGITFDSGGISIKPAEGMDNMKMDMGGAAAVLGTMYVVGELNLPLHVVGIVASAENMPSATSYKPGDIITTLSGKTVEVLNTDAEGRIVLADALFYAQRYQPDAIIDLATLTGAIMVALGAHAIGMFSNDDGVSERLARAGEASGERLWRLPLWEPYSTMIVSDIADIKNTGGRFGGAITAAAFLQHFVGSYPWAHLDIAGTAWVDRPAKPYQSKGATGVGVRMLVDALRNWEANV